MPNGGHGVHYESVGFCPRCNSPRIRVRRGRHWRILWRCQRCNRAFASPKIMLVGKSDWPNAVLAEAMPRMESRVRRRLGGRYGPTLGCLVTLVIAFAVLLGAFAVMDPLNIRGSFLPLVQTISRTAVPTPDPTVTPLPNLRHYDKKLYMLELINAEREKAGVPPVVLGDNNAAQLHAEISLENCTLSHWGIDGLKPYMRYRLAGGYQSNGENGRGSNYCIRESEGYRALGSIKDEVREAMEGWMDSSGHRRNILDRWHRKVNIGLAWDSYNFVAVQHFEGDYVEYDRLPDIENGVLTLAGRTKNGARFADEYDLAVTVYYDPPPRRLTRGQVARTYCYGSGRPVAGLRQPVTGGWYYDEHKYTKTYRPCPNPYDVSPEAPEPESLGEAHQFWQEAYNASQRSRPQTVTVPWITASKWTASGESLATADLSGVLPSMAAAYTPSHSGML